MRNKKAGLARRVRTRLARFPFCDGKVTILAGPSFLRINTLARILDPSAPHGVEIAPNQVNLVTWLRRDNQSMRTCCFTQSRQVRVLLGRATEVVKFFSHIDARSSWLGWGRGGGKDPSARNRYSPYKRGLNLYATKKVIALKIFYFNCIQPLLAWLLCAPKIGDKVKIYRQCQKSSIQKQQYVATRKAFLGLIPKWSWYLSHKQLLFIRFWAIFKCSNTRVTWGVFANNFPLSLAMSPSLIFASHLLQFFFLFTLQTQKAIGYMSGLLFTRKIYSLLTIIFASFKHCALLTLWPISGLPEIMPFPCYLFRKFTSRRQSAISIIRVANPDVHGYG